MKKLFLAIALLATVASCTKDNVTSQSREAIGFGGPFISNSVKSAVDPSYVTTDDNTKNNLTSFNVYGAVEGVNIFNGNLVSKSSSNYGSAWSCAGTTQYWVAGADYIFDAVVDATTVNTDNQTGLPVSLYYEASTQKDMLHNRVTTTGKPTTNNGLVAFSFTHLLSKVKFTVENTTSADATNYRYTVTDITITDTYATGKYAVVAQKDSDNADVTKNTWFDLTEEGTQTIADMTIASNTTEECANEVLLIPGAEVGVTFNVNAQIKDGNDWKTLTTTPVTKTGVVTLVANNAYNFQVSVGMGGKIEFTANTLPSWTNVTPAVGLN